MSSVLQPWLEELPIRMQSTLLLSLRGPDTHRCPEIKKIQRWMRGLSFKPGNPVNVVDFMTGTDDVPELQEKNTLARELEFCTQHFYSHLMHGLEVIAYRHPMLSIAHKALDLFEGMCKLFHLELEDEYSFEERLKTLEWPGGQEPLDFEDAVEIMGLRGTHETSSN